MKPEHKIYAYAYVIVLIISLIYGMVAQVSPTGYHNYNETIKEYVIDCPYGIQERFNESTEVVCGGINPLKYNSTNQKEYVELNINLSY